MPDRERTWTCTAASGRCSSFCEDERLHLGEVVAAVLWGEDVHRDECVVGEEAGFEDCRGTVVDELAGEFNALVDCLIRQVDELAPGELETCQRADLCSLIKPILQDLVRLELYRERFVHAPPEELVALDAGGVAGLGQSVHAENVRAGRDIATLPTPAVRNSASSRARWALYAYCAYAMVRSYGMGRKVRKTLNIDPEK